MYKHYIKENKVIPLGNYACSNTSHLSLNSSNPLTSGRGIIRNKQASDPRRTSVFDFRFELTSYVLVRFFIRLFFVGSWYQRWISQHRVVVDSTAFDVVRVATLFLAFNIDNVEFLANALGDSTRYPRVPVPSIGKDVDSVSDFITSFLGSMMTIEIGSHLSLVGTVLSALLFFRTEKVESRP